MASDDSTGGALDGEHALGGDAVPLVDSGPGNAEDFRELGGTTDDLGGGGNSFDSQSGFIHGDRGKPELPSPSIKNYEVIGKRTLHIGSMDKDSFGTRLRKARINAKLSQSELGRELGVTRNAVSLWESDDNMPTADKLSRIGNLTNVNVGDLIPGRAPAIVKDEILHSVGMPRDVPVRGIAVGGEDGAFVFESTTIDYVRRPERIKGIPEIYAVYVQGSSMSPWREPGSTVYVHPKQPAQIGDYVVVQTGVNGAPTAAYLKKLVRRTAKEIRLLQFNPPEEKLIPANKVLSIHRVIDWSELLGL